MFQSNLSFIQFQLFTDILTRSKDVSLSGIFFVALYRQGKDIDLKNAYVNVSASLLIGCAPGFFVGWLLSILIMSVEFWWYHFGGQLFKDAVTGAYSITWLFFLGFTALALAYFRKREGTAEGVK